MLLQSILLVFALLGVAALVVDMGYVRLSQVQMQSGAGTLQLTRSRNRMASAGATVHVAEGFAGVPDLELILAANRLLDGPLLAPAIVR
jgi:hypothetical protein